MARKKFDFKRAISDGLGAVGGGVAASFLNEKVSEMMPEQPKAGAIAPVLVGLFLSQQKNAMLSAAGLGMVGAGSAGFLEAFGVSSGLAGVGQLTRRQQARVIANMPKRSLPISANSGSTQQAQTERVAQAIGAVGG